MPTIELRFYEELNDFLPRRNRKRSYRKTIPPGSSVSDMLVTEGVPLDAVELVLASGESVSMDYRPKDGERLAIYPVFESIDLQELPKVAQGTRRNLRFVADAHLGKLAEYLRMLGFDTRYRNDFSDDELARISTDEQRILLSRDRALLERETVSRGYFVRAIRPTVQLREVLDRFDLYGQLRPFSRCMKCNATLKRVDKETVAFQLQPDTFRRYQHFWQCQGCNRVYWKGTHYDRMREWISALRRQWGQTNRS